MARHDVLVFVVAVSHNISLVFFPSSFLWGKQVGSKNRLDVRSTRPLHEVARYILDTGEGRLEEREEKKKKNAAINNNNSNDDDDDDDAHDYFRYPITSYLLGTDYIPADTTCHDHEWSTHACTQADAMQAR